jgi:hypothetical protein
VTQSRLRYGFFVLAAITLAEWLLLAARRVHSVHPKRDAAGNSTLLWVAVGFSVVALVLGAIVALRGRGSESSSQSTEWTWGIAATYCAGILCGAVVRAVLGDSAPSNVAQASAPITAALLISVTLAAEKFSGYQRRQLALLYLLVSALAIGFAGVGGRGWFFGLCYVLIIAGLFAGAALALDLVLTPVAGNETR